MAALIYLALKPIMAIPALTFVKYLSQSLFADALSNPADICIFTEFGGDTITLDEICFHEASELIIGGQFFIIEIEFRLENYPPAQQPLDFRY